VLASEDESDALAAVRFSLADDIVELVVLTTDDGFLQTLREGVGASRRLWHVLSADKISDLLAVGGVGILVVDVQSLNHAAARFVAGIKRQFPDLVVVAAGNRESETELAPLISDGSIYRFIHKPMSPARATLFADAAVKRYQNQRERTVAVVAAPMAGARRRYRRILIGVTGAAVTVLLAAGWLVHRQNVEEADVTAGTASARPAVSTPASTAPPGPGQTFPAARGVLMDAQDRLLARARAALDQQRLDEAASTIEAARKTGIATERVAQLATELARARERARAAPPRAASAPPASPAAAGTPASPAVESPSVSAPAAGPDAATATVPTREVPAHQLRATEPNAAAVPPPDLPAPAVPAPELPAADLPAAAVPAPERPAPQVPAATLPAAVVPAAELPAPALPAPSVTTPAVDAIAPSAPSAAPAPDPTEAVPPQADALRHDRDAALVQNC
jgi:hypothetical protein